MCIRLVAYEVGCNVGCTHREKSCQWCVQMLRYHAVFCVAGVHGFEPQFTDPAAGVPHDETGRACMPPHVKHTAGILIKRNSNLMSNTAHYRS